MDQKEEDMIKHVMEMSKEESKLEEAKMTEEELQMKLIIEKSKQEAKMQEMNNELIRVMMEIEKNKPEDGWGFKRTELSAEDSQDEQKVFEHLQSNLKQAIKRLEMNNLQNAIQDLNTKNQKSDDILSKTTSDSQTLEDRKKRLQDHREKLLEERNAERKEDLMRSTFQNMKNFENQAEGILERQKQ